MVKLTTALLSSLPLINVALAGKPMLKRAPSHQNQSDIDVTILQYALTLENLENTFYAEVVNTLGEQAFSDAGYEPELVKRIGMDEQTHVDFLSGALKALNQTPTQPCEYEFGYTDVDSFFAVANILEGVGVSAYLGAAAKIASDVYLTAAASILSVESRHSAFIRGQLGKTPFPAAFDTPLDFNEVYSLASLFIRSCPESNPALPVKAFPVLTAQLTDDKKHIAIKAEDETLFADQEGELYAIFISFPENVPYPFDPENATVERPEQLMGQEYVVISKSKELKDEDIIAGPAVIDLDDYSSSS